MYAYMNVRIYICNVYMQCMYECIYVRMNICMYARTYEYICMYLRIYMYVCM